MNPFSSQLRYRLLMNSQVVFGYTQRIERVDCFLTFSCMYLTYSRKVLHNKFYITRENYKLKIKN